MRDRPAEHQIGQRAAAAAEELGRPAPRLGVEFRPADVVAFEPPVDDAEDVLEVDRLRAGPAAPDTAEQGGGRVDEEAPAGDDEEQQPHVAQAQRRAEQVEATMFDVEEHRGKAADLDPRQEREEGDEQPSHDPAGPPPGADHDGGLQEAAGAVLADRRDALADGASVHGVSCDGSFVRSTDFIRPSCWKESR